MSRILQLLFIFTCLAGCKKDKDVFQKGTPSDFLSDANYPKMKVELVHVAGMRPSASTVNNIRDFLNKHLKKPDGIEIVEREISSPGKAAYSIDDLRQVELAHRSTGDNKKEISAWLFFADGDYNSNGQGSKILGVAYGTSSMAVFEKTILDYSGGLTQPDETTVETVVANHELGHILGLVNNGITMTNEHQDVAHGHHCNNTRCLMYYAVETSDIIANLLGNAIPALDENCVNDLHKAGGK